MSRPLRVLGVMTGTSCDGLDATLIETNGRGWKALWSASLRYPPRLRARVLEIQRAKAPELLEALALDRELGDWYGSALGKLLARRAKSRVPIVIANHGQTIVHRPGPGRAGITLQLGDPSRIAERTGVSVVSHFRHGDLAAGGEGAPLAPLFHKLLLGGLTREARGLSVHNLGGISNLTYLGPGGRVLAFDTGPGNIWIDAAAAQATRGRQRMDEGGRLARQGKIDVRAVRAALKHPYFNRAIPKSTGRDDFPFDYLLARTRARGADLVATATALTVESVARAYERWVLSRRLPLSWILVCGGGARNPTLMDWLGQRMPGQEIMTVAEAGLDARYIEAEAFAVLGYLSLEGRPVGGEWTGAKGFAPPGWITPGKNWPAVMAALSQR